jgi:lipoprotein-anchoring transpeptidase ErfK/SrfK
MRRAPGSRRSRGRRGAVGLAAFTVAALAATFVWTLIEPGSNRTSDAAAADRGEAASAALPQPAEPAFVPGKARYLDASADLTRWAVVRASAIARVRPDEQAPAVTRVSTRTPEGTSNIVLVLGDRVDRRGALWIRVRLALLGHRDTAWLPRRALGGYGTVRTRLVIDVDSFSATLYRNGKPIFKADVGVGMPSWPTPRGSFYIRDKLTGFASPMYGPIAFGTSARSRVLTDWPAGGFVGIHGTDQPGLIPGRISHGCIRMRNEDIVRLAKLMPVGTPLTIH